jgi:hypothetical protein
MYSTINAFSKLGEELIELSQSWETSPYSHQLNKSLSHNPWFTKESVQMAIAAYGNELHEDKITRWLSNYKITTPASAKTIGLVMAGNIPLVGFHDLLCALVAGHRVVAKLSSKDQVLYEIIKDILVKINPVFEARITFTDSMLKNIDAIIATGSDNSARYFEYYFKKYPNIIRKNRNSLAILTGNESFDDLQSLGTDIFTYFGLGCRNVSFLLIPENYKFDVFFQAIETYNFVANHNKYGNNYEYQKAIMMMNAIPLFDNGFVLLKEDASISSPVGVIHFMNYKTDNEVRNFIEVNKHKIQCIVSKTNWPFNTYGLGKAQQPELWDYADNMDTLAFLLTIN